MVGRNKGGREDPSKDNKSFSQSRSNDEEKMQMSMEELRRRLENENVANAQVDEQLQDDFQRWKDILMVRWVMYEEQRKYNMRCQGKSKGRDATIWRILSMVQQELEEKLQMEKILGSCRRFPSPMALMDDERSVGDNLQVLEPVRDVLSGRGGSIMWEEPPTEQQSSVRVSGMGQQYKPEEPWDMQDECTCTACVSRRRQEKYQQPQASTHRKVKNESRANPCSCLSKEPNQMNEQSQPMSFFVEQVKSQPRQSQHSPDCTCPSVAIGEGTRQPESPKSPSRSTFSASFGCQFHGDPEQHLGPRRTDFLKKFNKITKLNKSGMLVPASALLELAGELPQNVGRAATWTCHKLPAQQLHNVGKVPLKSHETVKCMPQRPRRIREDPNDSLLVYVNEKFDVDAQSGMGNSDLTSYYSAIELQPKQEPEPKTQLGYCPLCDKRHLRMPPPF
ncbi:uncharacterized protein LOC117579241 [Drosophila guanche]|uniref:Uncharacterized protein n=1 Tax=Drosophila guanche TaxID=7266 RepID=A0A3B0JNM5_DROGU|nr:uncharacterized protein LOC117579241 [Drosophila guanche]SPP77120.1 Hypothetical predicted protein [Drosophila guanche]